MANSGKQQLLAFLLIMVVLFLTPKYMEYITPPTSETSTKIIEEELGLPYVENNLSKANQETDIHSIAKKKFVNEISFTIETDLYIAEISNAGGGTLKSFLLKNYVGGFSDNGLYFSNDPVDILIPDENRCSPCLAVRNHFKNNVKYFDKPFSTEIQNGEKIVLSNGESESFTFNFIDEAGNNISKTLTAFADFYFFNYEINTQSLEEGSFTREIAWTKSLRPTEKNPDHDVTESGAVIWQADNKESIAQTSADNIPIETLDGQTDWVAIKSKYFIASIIPDNKGIYGTLEAENNTFANREITPGYRVHIGHHSNDKLISGKIFIGPQDVVEMRTTDSNIEEAMNWGYSIIRPISKLILRLLKFLHQPIAGLTINYGIVLILFAFLIRIITGPLTKKATISNQKIQQLQPQIKKLQAKFKDDPMKLNQETMALWRKHNVNPLGGCLPIIIQMPLLFALFVTFRTTIEFRGEPFFLWINDLSQPDIIMNLPFHIPIYGAHIAILPLFMGITMFFQQKFTSASIDSSQKPIMYMMTGFFFLIFNSFPSGLNLYYATSNLLNIIQQWNLKKTTKLSTSS